MVSIGETPRTRTRADEVGEESPPLSPTLGAYKILGVLGSGGMGVVYEALDERLGRRVALKRLHGTHHHLRILREAQALARLAHPNVVSVYEVFASDDERLCIVMELVAGRTLRAWIDEARPSLRERVDALLQAGQGIAAAHAAGLVHRDLKPDNIMIDGDGRVRVMDFGLARAAVLGDDVDEAESALAHDLLASLSSSVDALRAPVTVANALLGTPGYMAPECYLGRVVDVRSDIFAFSVVAFEVVHGRRPFAAQDHADLRRATLAGELAASDGDGVPPWLDRVIRRGLALDPEARWPTMSALLAALADDPVARRRQRLRTLGLVGLVGLIAAGLTYGVFALARSREAWRAEEAAQARLSAVQATIERAEAEGTQELAEAAFRAFVRDPAHHGTAALSRAWRWRGARSTERPEDAFAEAYVTATTEEDAVLALGDLSEVFRGDRDGDALARAATLLDDAGGDPDEVAQLAFEASLWRGDLAGAAAATSRPGHPQQAWAPLLDRLSRTRETDYQVHGLSVLPAGGAARVAAYDSKSRVIRLLDPELREVGRWPVQEKPLLIDGSPLLLDQRDRTVSIVDLLTGEIRGRGPSEAVPYMAQLFDGDRDGAPEVYFSRHWPALGFRRWDLEAAREEVAYRDAEALDSVLNAAVVGDLDGDGLPELAVAFGEWNAFDLRIFRGRADGELEQLHQQRFGRIAMLAIVRREGRPLLVAVNDEIMSAPEILLDPPHTGAPAGVHFFTWDGAALTEVANVPLPSGPSAFRGDRAGVAGDLDGDGDDDLAFDLVDALAPWTLLLRQDDAGFAPLLVADLKLLGGGDLDGDGTVELFAADPKTRALLALGVGDSRRGAPQAEVEALPPPPALRDPLLRDRWRRGDELHSLGLTEAAASSLYEASLVAADDEAPPLLDRAAALFVAAERRERALEIDRALQENPEYAAAALARSARTLRSLGRYREAEAAAHALLRSPRRRPEEAALARSILGELAGLLDPTLQIELAFDEPLRPEWKIFTPGALRRDPAVGDLELVIPGDPSPVAALDIDWDGGPIALDFELTLEHLEFGACVAIAIAEESGRSWLGAGICGMGGGGALFRQRRLRAGFDGWLTADDVPWPSAHGAQRWDLHLSYIPERRRVELTDPELSRRAGVEAVSQPSPAGRHTLLIGTLDNRGAQGLAVGRLHRLAIRGAKLAHVTPAERERHTPARLLAEGEPLAALQSLASLESATANATFVELLAHAELADLEGLRSAARRAAQSLDDPALRSQLALVLRASPVAAAALRDAAGPRLLPTLQAVWTIAKPHRNDPHLRRRVLDALAGIEALIPEDRRGRQALRELLRTRARMRRYSGDLERARQDLERALAVDAVDEDERREQAALADDLAALEAP